MTNPSCSRWFVGITLTRSSSTAPSYEPLYAESFWLVRSDSDANARAKVVGLATANLASYANEAGDTISWHVETIVDVKEVDEDELENQELYTRHFRNIDAYRNFEPLLGGSL